MNISALCEDASRVVGRAPGSPGRRRAAPAAVALLALGLASAASPGPARADDDLWGCQVLLCMSNPAGPTAVAECRPPIWRLWRHLRRGRPFPSCAQAGFQGGRVGYDPWRCPEAGEEGGEDTSWVITRRWDPEAGVNEAWCVSLVRHVEATCTDGETGETRPCSLRVSRPATRREQPHFVDLPNAGADGGPGRVWFRVGEGGG